MPGDDWQRFANLRSLLAYQWFFPGKILMFMGGEFGQSEEWNCDAELSWNLLNEGPFHRGVQRLVSDMNRIYCSSPELYEADFDARGFQWIDCSDSEKSVFSFVRRDGNGQHESLVVMNFTPQARDGYRIGLTRDGYWKEILNTDSSLYGGSERGNLGGKHAEPIEIHGQPFSAEFCLPPLSVSVFKREAIEGGG
jgi:1,4-alpha-glucan branching enzyme